MLTIKKHLTPSTAMLAAFLLVAALGGLIFLVVSSQTGTADAPYVNILGGDKDQSLRNQGYTLTATPQGYSPKFSTDSARQYGTGQYGGGKVTNVVLAHMSAKGPDSNIDRNVWVIVFDPSTVTFPGSGAAASPTSPSYALMFLDADTGAFLFGIAE